MKEVEDSVSRRAADATLRIRFVDLELRRSNESADPPRGEHQTREVDRVIWAGTGCPGLFRLSIRAYPIDRQPESEKILPKERHWRSIEGRSSCGAT